MGEKSVKLTVISHGQRGTVFEINEGSNLVGRWDPESGSYPEVDLENEDPEAKVSRKHAVIFKSGENISIEDAGSLNGTFINRGERLKPNIRYPLSDTDEIMVGKTFLKLEFV